MLQKIPLYCVQKGGAIDTFVREIKVVLKSNVKQNKIP